MKTTTNKTLEEIHETITSIVLCIRELHKRLDRLEKMKKEIEGKKNKEVLYKRKVEIDGE